MINLFNFRFYKSKLMKKITTLFFLLFSIASFSQTTFKNGYFITNDNNKTECLIKDFNWLKNPTEFKYKSSEQSVIKTNILSQVIEFGVYDEFKFIKKEVEIDQSKHNTSKLTLNKNPEFVRSTIFLKVLIEGKANLYAYTDNVGTKFYYNINNSEIRPLIYKPYLDVDDSIKKNNTYKMELRDNLTHSNMTLEDFKNLNYKTNSLINLFTKYNELDNEDFKTYRVKNEFFKLNIRPGFNLTSLTIKSPSQGGNNVEFDSKLTFRLGLEAEFTLPFNNNKWAIIVEPTYTKFKGDSDTSGSTVKINYSAIEVPIGIRHYFFLNQKTKLFLNTGFGFDINNSSTIEVDNFGEGDINSGQNFMLGIGFNNGKKISTELRYYTNKDISRRGANVTSNLSSLAFIFGYRLF